MLHGPLRIQPSRKCAAITIMSVSGAMLGSIVNSAASERVVELASSIV